jgi:hypothetical protein
MARHLCIVARENSPLYGYLTIAFRDRPPGASTLDIVLDRRQAGPQRESETQKANGISPDRRRHSAVEEAVRTRGYAIFTGPGGGAPSRNDEAFIERAIGLLADVERRGPLALRFNARRRAIAAGIARSVVTVLVILLVLAAVLRLGGIGRIADAAADWGDATLTRLEEAWLTLRGQPGSAPRSDRGPGDGAAIATSATQGLATNPERAEPASAPAAPTPSAALPEPPSPQPMAPPVEPPRVVSQVPTPPATAPAARAPAVEAPPPSPSLASLSPGEREAAPVPLPTFTGVVPRVEMSRQSSLSGSGVVYSVRLTDAGGRAVPGAQIWLLGRTTDGQTRETRLDDDERPGIYKSGALPPDLMSARLSVRVFFSNMRVEIPIEN